VLVQFEPVHCTEEGTEKDKLAGELGEGPMKDKRYPSCAVQDDHSSSCC